MALKPSRKWIISFGLPEQGSQWAADHPDAVTFDALTEHGDCLNDDTDITSILPYYWTDLVREVDDILRSTNTDGLPSTLGSCPLGRSLEDLICRPAKAFRCYKEYPSVKKTCFRGVLTHLTKRFDLPVQRQLIRVHSSEVNSKCGLAIMLDDETDRGSHIRQELFELFPLFRWGEGTICESSRKVDVKDKDEIAAVTAYIDRVLPKTSGFARLTFCPNIDNSCVEAYSSIWARSGKATKEHSAFDVVAVPIFTEIVCLGPELSIDQVFLHGLLRHELNSFQENRLVLLMPSQLLVDRSLKSMKDINDFFAGWKSDGTRLEKEYELKYIKSYQDPTVKPISMTVIEICRKVVRDNPKVFAGTARQTSVNANPKAGFESVAESLDVRSATKPLAGVGSEDDEGSSIIGSVEENEEQRTDGINLGESSDSSEEVSSNESEEDDDTLPEAFAPKYTDHDTSEQADSKAAGHQDSSSSKSQPQSEVFRDLVKTVLSPETWYSSESSWKRLSRDLMDKGMPRTAAFRMKHDPKLAPLFAYLKDKENDTFLSSKREGEQLTWLQWALREAVVAKGKGAFYVTQLLLLRCEITNDRMFKESLLMTCLKQPGSSCEVANHVSSKMEIRSHEKDSEGRTVLHLSVKRKLQLTVQNICRRSPEMAREKDTSGKTPLDYATELQESLKAKHVKDVAQNRIRSIIEALRAATDGKGHSEEKTESASKRRRLSKRLF